MGTICGISACPTARRDGEVYGGGMGLFARLKQRVGNERICTRLKVNTHVMYRTVACPSISVELLNRSCVRFQILASTYFYNTLVLCSIRYFSTVVSKPRRSAEEATRIAVDNFIRLPP